MEHIRSDESPRRERPRKTHRRRRRSELPRSAPLAPERGWTRAAWQRCVETEALIDLGEWLEATCRESLPETLATDHAFTSSLWTFVETVPFSELGPTSVEERIRRIHRAAVRCLYWALSPALQVPSAPGGVIGFVAEVRDRCGHSRWSLFRLHVEKSRTGSVFLTIGLASELKGHPCCWRTDERTARGRPGAREAF
jgi:hypothetical protein